VRGKPFLAVDYPLIADEIRLASKLPRIGARLRFCHRVARGDLTREQRLEVLLFLVRSAVPSQDFHVARIRCLATKYRRTKATAAENLVHQPQFDLAIPLTAEVGIKVARPKSLIFNDFLKGRHGGGGPRTSRIEGVGRSAKHQIERLDLRANEFAHPIQFFLKVRLGFEIPRHVQIPPFRSARATPATQKNNDFGVAIG